MNILITGVAGLIGSNLADWINKNKSEIKVVGMDNLSGGFIDNINDQVDFYQLDISDHDIDSIFDQYRFDIVFHFAAYAAEGLSPFVRKFNYTNNLVTTAKLITLSIKYGIGRFVFTSSMATYGRGNPPFNETDELRPIDPYGIAKLACEMDLRVANEQHGLDYCIIRPHNVYGPKQNIWDKYRNVLGIWMNGYLNDETIVIYGDGKQRRSFSYIGDCVAPLWKAGIEKKASGEIINLGGTTNYSIDEASDIVIEVMGGGKKEFKEARHEVKDAWSTWEKSEKLLGYKDNTSLKQGLTVMWEWVLKQPKRPKQIWEIYELDKGIYEYWQR